MDRETIIGIIVNHKPYKRYCDKLANYQSIADDLLQEFRLFILEKPEQELIKIYNTGGIEQYCLSIIYRKSKEINRMIKLKGKDNPLCSISFNSVGIDRLANIEDNSYNPAIDENYDKVMRYINSDESITLEDFLILTETMNCTELTELSKQSGIPYITLRTKRKRIKDKIKANVSI